MRQALEQEAELAEIVVIMVGELKAELGTQASVNEIEAALLKRQSSLMSQLLEHLVEHQDFPPSGAKC